MPERGMTWYEYEGETSALLSPNAGKDGSDLHVQTPKACQTPRTTNPLDPRKPAKKRGKAGMRGTPKARVPPGYR